MSTPIPTLSTLYGPPAWYGPETPCECMQESCGDCSTAYHEAFKTDPEPVPYFDPSTLSYRT